METRTVGALCSFPAQSHANFFVNTFLWYICKSPCALPHHVKQYSGCVLEGSASAGSLNADLQLCTGIMFTEKGPVLYVSHASRFFLMIPLHTVSEAHALCFSPQTLFSSFDIENTTALKHPVLLGRRHIGKVPLRIYPRPFNPKNKKIKKRKFTVSFKYRGNYMVPPNVWHWQGCSRVEDTWPQHGQ